MDVSALANKPQKLLKGQTWGHQLKSDQIKVKIRVWGQEFGLTDRVLAQHSGVLGSIPSTLQIDWT